MKIDEPKTPYVPHYNPDDEDDDETGVGEGGAAGIDTDDIAVDELDLYKGGGGGGKKKKKKGGFEEDIPDLELGEPEETVSEGARAGEADRILRVRSLSAGSSGKGGGDRHVVMGQGGGLDSDRMSVDGEEEKHHEFEEKRKKHYEMTNVKDLLG